MRKTVSLLLTITQAAFGEIIDRFQEAIDRELWIPKSNSAQNLLTKFRKNI